MKNAKDKFGKVDQMDKHKAKATEHDRIVRAVAKWLKDEGYEVYKGKKLGEYIADLVGVKSKDDTIAVEVKSGKINEIRKGLAQGQTYLDWVHEVYLAIPSDFISLGKDIAKHTSVGLLVRTNGVIAIVKDAERVRPLEENLLYVLSKTTGFCWLCGRTFNVVPRCKNGIYIAYKEMEPKLHKSVEMALKKRFRTAGSWAELCVICSRILGAVAGEFMYRIITKGKKVFWVDFDTDWFDDLIPLLVKRIQKEERKQRTSD